MKKALKMTGIIIVSAIGLIIIAVTLFINLSSQFGRTPSKEQIEKYSALANFTDGKFRNLHDSPMNVSIVKLFREFTKSAPDRKPKSEIKVTGINSANIENADSNQTKLFWFGHSTFLLLMDGKKILLDPVFSQIPSPVPFFGTKRYSQELPITIEELPSIDAVIISHDHYDHLDYASITKLKNKVDKFFVPTGVKNHLLRWEVDEKKITELYWWEDVEFDSTKLVCTPARHFSGRGMFDRASTLWASWVIQGKKEKIFFSGDSGYDTHFKEIGDEFGPFDITLMECGQYNEDWKYLHMMPEETAQA